MFKQRDTKRHTDRKTNKTNLKKTDTNNYPQVKNVNPKGSLLPASEYKSKNITIIINVMYSYIKLILITLTCHCQFSFLW